MGSCETLFSCDTYQFDYYSKYRSSMFDEAHKRAVREEQFPRDLQAARELGMRIGS